MYFLKVFDNVIAFEHAATINLARYAIRFKDNVYPRAGGGYTIFNHRNAQLTDVTNPDPGVYRIGWIPSKDAASMFKVFKLLTEEANEHGA